MKIAVVLGTRPEIIKMAPVVRALEKQGIPFFILHTGQHYSYDLDRVFFEQLQLPAPAYNLEAGSGSHAEQTARILVSVEKVLQKEKPDVVLVQGDTNSVLAGALASVKLHIKVGHVEAGLRSYDRTMPEEINRVVADHCADYLFAPTEKAQQILLSEGIPQNSVFVTGNTIVDAVSQNLELAKENNRILESLELEPQGYFLVTLHRQENVDDVKRYTSILRGLHQASIDFNVPVIYPIHPRSRKRLAEFGIKADKLRFINPVDYFSFLQLERNARLILTDSGGVQEESCILKVPCVTLRDNTERPETLEAGSNVLAGTAAEKIVECARKMLGKPSDWHNPFGDGHAGERIVAIITGGRYG